MALSDKPFVCFYQQSQYTIAPLSYEALEHVSSFSSTQCFEGIVGIKGKELRIIQIERLGEVFTQKLLQTRYTPTKLQVNPTTKQIVMIEKEFNCFTLSERQALRSKISEAEENEEYANVDYQRVGYPKPGVVKGQAPFASCLRVVDPLTMTTCFVKEFEDQETVFSLFVSQNLGAHNRCFLFLGVGMAANLQG